MNKRMIKTGMTMLMIALLATACTNVDKLMDQGRYSDVIYHEIKKLQGKKVKKSKYIIPLEQAFESARLKDMREIQRQSRNNSPESWDKVFALAGKIEDRQNRLRPFLPLVDEKGKKANFTFVKTEPILNDAEQNLVKGYYERGLRLLESASGDRRDNGRQAYEDFVRVSDFRHPYSNLNALINESLEMGVTRVKLAFRNDAFGMVPFEFVDIIMDQYTGKKGDSWVRLIGHKSEEKADYKAMYILDEIIVSREHLHRDEEKFKKTIEDGWEYVLDKKGNVKKDSLGNDIKETVYKDVRATLIKTHQEKTVTVRGRYVLIDTRLGKKMKTQPIEVNNIFNHHAQRHRGDERALKKEDREIIRLIDFPNDTEMVMLAAPDIQKLMKKEIRKIERL